MTDRGEWICRSCHAQKQAIATTKLHQATEATAALWPWFVLGGIFMLILAAILWFLYSIGQGFGRAL